VAKIEDRAKIAANINFKTDKHGVSVLIINTKSEMMTVGVTECGT
jgi:hypothetical protein